MATKYGSEWSAGILEKEKEAFDDLGPQLTRNEASSIKAIHRPEH
jgi:hypothetical protein